MSHYCICNARYTINPDNLEMFVRARKVICQGEEISVQYLSALVGNFKRRRKILTEWYFDCLCKRCSDPTECGTFISAIKCFQCNGDLLPINSLDYESQWKCDECEMETSCEHVEKIVDALQEELDAITSSGQFQEYERFIEKYSGKYINIGLIYIDC